jgi:hypothetical protein
MESGNCAVDLDGNLLDASQITWYNDPGDDKPIAPATASTTAQRQLSATTLDSFITKVPPAADVAGSRRSTHTTRPSTKVTDPDNAMVLKRKPSHTPATNLARRPCHTSAELENATEPDSESTDAEEDNPFDPDDACEETKALGDADREVCVHLSPQIVV